MQPAGSDDGAGSSRSGSSSPEGGGCGGGAEVSLSDAGAPARVLGALNALRKARQHYDVLLQAGGEEVPAHRAVLAAASPALLTALAAAGDALRVDGVGAEALRALVEFAYTGRLWARDAAAARRLYAAAAALRVDAARAPLAERLLAAATPHDCVALRALPFAPDQLRRLDEYIQVQFDAVCGVGALAALPTLAVELLRASSAHHGEETSLAVADAALAWLRRHKRHLDLEELCARTHMLYVDARGELRDCSELPASDGEAPELTDYRRAAAERAPADERAPTAERPERGDDDEEEEEWKVVAARASGAGTRALLVVGSRLAGARVTWRGEGAGGGAGAGGEGGGWAGVGRGGTLGGARAGGPRLAAMSVARCALGAAALDGRLVVCGGYDRARVLVSAEAYSPGSNAWAPLAHLPGPRARFAAAAWRGGVLALGGSDGSADLATAELLAGGAWRAAPRLPLARAHAAAAAAPGALFLLGGLAAGHCLRRVDRLAGDAWTDAPPLLAGRSQCAGVVWGGCVWALGGCDAWHCLASTEWLRLGAGGAAAGEWRAGPALPTARRSAAAAAWRGRLLVVGGSDGAASLRRCDQLVAPPPSAPDEWGEWRPAPELRRARAALALAELHGALYAAGGFDGKRFLACVECLYEPDGEWTQLWRPPAPAPALAPAPADDDAPAPAS